MKDWVTVITTDDLTHKMERVHEGQLVTYCQGTRMGQEVIILQSDPPLSCLICAAWWRSDFGAVDGR